MARPVQSRGSEEGTQAGGEAEHLPCQPQELPACRFPEPLAPDLWPSGCPEGLGSGPRKESRMLRAPWGWVAFMSPGHRTL